MRILNIGMNHKTAPVEVREKLTSGDMLDYLIRPEVIKEALCLRTCNRIEALVVTEDEDNARKAIISYFCGLGELTQDKILNFIYIFKDLDAVRHIFRVASSLDSMVIGEPQILGQIKDAYAEAVSRKTTGVILNSLMHRAFHVAKKVRTETGICESAVSVSYAAVELAKKIFDTLSGKKVLLIGAGEMAELTAKHLISQGVKEVVVANRTFENAVELASKFGSHPISFEEIPVYLIEADIVITSTASPHYIIKKDMLKGISRKRRNRPLFFIDIAVPRDVEPEVNKLDNIYLYDIDDLKGVAEMNMEQRRQEAIKAERIVEEEVLKFKRWLETLDIVPTIISLKNKAYSIIEKEIKRSESKLKGLTAEQKNAVFVLCKSIAEKLINDPIIFLKSKAGRSSLNTYLDFTRKLFNLEEQGKEDLYEGSRHKLDNK
jgi:glutamyl-tRNA reductase